MSRVEIESDSYAEVCASSSSRLTFKLDNVPVAFVGPASAWFETERRGSVVMIHPTRPLPSRCLVRPMALLQQDRGLPEINTGMGRLLFQPGDTQAQSYAPFTCDPQRRLRELFLAVEATPDDDAFSSSTRWSNCAAIAKELLSPLGIRWPGLPPEQINYLLSSDPWHQPLEGCILHALTHAASARGDCVIEIGSYRGRSACMLALALRSADSDSLLLSIDPHAMQPHTREQVLLTLKQIGEDQRLVQFNICSGDAWRTLRPSTASLIFIDGDHSYQAVVADFDNYRDILAPGGYLVFHDYGYGAHNGHPDVVPDVRRAIDEHIIHASGFRPLLLAHTLFVVQKLPA